MKRIYTLFMFCLFLLHFNNLCSQLSITATDTDFTINFDNTVSGVNTSAFDGSGFQPTPNPGQLDSDGWSVSGLSDGNLEFGGTGDSGDWARGISTGGVTTGGIYAFEVSINDYALGCQPGGSDFAPGSFILKFTNNTGGTLDTIDIAYDIYAYNDQDRANSFNFAHSGDDITYTNIPALDYTTVEAADPSPVWVSTNRSTSISVSIPDGADYYLQWNSADVSGSGSRDELALDNIVISVSGSASASCAITASGLSNITCDDNGTPNDVTDDYITFELNPTASDSGSNGYNVTAANPDISITPGNAVYGIPTTFSTQGSSNWNAGDGNFDITLADADSMNCTFDALVTDPGACSTPPPPELMVSQYIDTDVGTTPKGIELWNNSGTTLDFSTSNLVIEKGTNGGVPSFDFGLNSGTMAPDEVIVIGTSDIGTYLTDLGLTSVVFHDKGFTFNGDDALVIKYGGVITDVIGEPEVDPGSAWSGNGVSTADQNIELLLSIQSGDLDGWSDPSLRFETNNTNPSDATNGLDGFGLAPGEVLPVTWLTFNATKRNQKSILQWTTTNEINNSHFVVEHSIDGRHWSDVGRVKAVTRQRAVNHYEFIHESPDRGMNFYRLRQVDIDGDTDHSIVQKVGIHGKQQREVTLYPNPAGERLYLNGLQWKDDTEVLIYPISGDKVHTVQDATLEIPIHFLPSGVYFLMVTSGEESQQYRFIKS